jgi:hypothetical protein
MEPIAVESLRELQTVFEWVRGREDDLTESSTVLVGGWAVYAYNPYWGSVDIDLVANNRARASLRKHLLDNHGFRPDEDGLSASASVFKDTPAGKVSIDFASRGPDVFEGSHGSFDQGIITGNVQVRRIADQEIPVPSRSVLLMMKTKAAWDRRWRYDHGASMNPTHEWAKIIKDYSDILALIDPARGGTDLSIGQLGRFFSENEFIRPVLDRVAESGPGAEKYGISPESARNMVEGLRRIIY